MEIIDNKYDLIKQLKGENINEPIRFLYNNYYNPIVAIVKINDGTEEDGADIFQETVMVIIEKIKSGEFREESSLKTYMIAIAKNLWFQELRTRKRRQSREVNYTRLQVDDLVNPVDNIDRVDVNILQDLFSDIGTTCREILTGFYYKKLSMREMLKSFSFENEQVLRNKKSKCMKKLKDNILSNNYLINNLKSLLR